MSGLKTLFVAGITLCCFSAVNIPAAAQLHEAFLPQQENAVRDQCLVNQRVLIGAIEMYNMDHTDCITGIDDKTLQNPDSPVSQYLTEPLQIMPGCSLTSTGDLTKDGHILCPIHGSSTNIDKSTQELEDRKSVV
jgi:hypothetical protein